MVNEYPTVCNLCGNKIVYISNERIYGKQYGSGYAYYCPYCGAYVGTHKPEPKRALGLLANKQMRILKMECHELFDNKWNNSKQRSEMYKRLADKMGIDTEQCHFGWFDIKMLNKAREILLDDF